MNDRRKHERPALEFAQSVLDVWEDRFSWFPDVLEVGKEREIDREKRLFASVNDGFAGVLWHLDENSDEIDGGWAGSKLRFGGEKDRQGGAEGEADHARVPSHRGSGRGVVQGPQQGRWEADHRSECGASGRSDGSFYQLAQWRKAWPRAQASTTSAHRWRTGANGVPRILVEVYLWFLLFFLFFFLVVIVGCFFFGRIKSMILCFKIKYCFIWLTLCIIHI